jgi:DinB superfamily
MPPTGSWTPPGSSLSELLENAVGLLATNYAIAHGRVIESAERTDDRQFAKSMGMRVHSVAWQVWHIARWDDRFAEILVEKTPELAGRFGPPQQIWAAESLAKQWGLPIGHMGRRDTGTEMDDESADALRLPDKPLVIDYARRVFARLQAVLKALPEARIFTAIADDPDGDTYAHNIMLYLDHVQRHLGMIEALLGLQGTAGTATN